MPPQVVGKGNYKVDADQIQVIDRSNYYVGTDVETVLREIYFKLGTGGGTGNIKTYSTIANEYPSTTNDFFQDENLDVYRSSPDDTSVNYDGANTKIEFISTATSGIKQFNCSVRNNYFYGAIKTSVKLNNSGNIVRLRLNKSNNYYYELEVTCGGYAKLYSYLNGVKSSVIAQDTTLIQPSQYYEFLFFKTGAYIYLYISGNRIFNITDGSINRAGKTEIVFEIPASSAYEIYCQYMEFGEIAQSLL